MCSNAIVQLAKVLDQDSIVRLKNAADAAQQLEDRWMKKLRQKYDKLNEFVLWHLEEYGEVPKSLGLLDFYMDHSFESLSLGMRTAQTREQETALPTKAMLARPPKGKVARSFKDLMTQWDSWRRKKKALPRQKALASKIEKQYLQKVQSVWEKHSRDFRNGSTFTQDEVRAKIIKAAETTYGRAKTIVQTETTHYYNKARRDVYDTSPDVTHYLFVPIRDMATTPWCNTRRGLVYKKGDSLLDKETPPIHWNCRSELLPLTPHNPKHAALINDPSRDRRKVNPAPLPKGWNRVA